ncbi:DUF1572 domain-containing protein [Marinilongibacter aquaticus]|uniref:DUF1572 domain-containing protein n=1 Tax=Marinilongibacter aquaticus TaxID=2975157 RepID=UPI0021BD22BF|nr:DUF1572 domain-containing protein [Marinilongibacter aquaticus]UBM57732.1 DUF1572 domain-containing protein [Marinilongibacter aquaticus]
MNLSEIYLQNARENFADYKLLGERSMEQMADDDLFWKPNAVSNSVAVIVNHLWGNMLSRWTDFLHSDGEKPWRKRDEEFEEQITSRKELVEKWNAGWACLLQTLDSLEPEDLEKKITIRGQELFAIEAINRQLTHYASHVGQIMMIGKMRLGENWSALSIQKGKSQEFNREMKGINRESI